MHTRAVISLITLALAACATGSQPAASASPETASVAARIGADVDHIIVGIDSLERGIRLLREATGVTPVFGGAHPGRGTQNALLSLGRGVYLELIAPNFQDTAAARNVAFFSHFRTLTPYGWAVHTPNADTLRARAVSRGLGGGVVQPGSRARPDGSTLRWRTITPWGMPRGPYLPFFIEWSPGPHPSTDSPAGCTLAGLRMVSPAPDSLRAYLERADLRIPVVAGASEGLQFALDCPRGRLEIPPGAWTTSSNTTGAFGAASGVAQALDPFSRATRIVPLGRMSGDVEILSGHPDSAGMLFVMRIRELPGTILPPHSHPVDENITVVQGTMLFGTGAYDTTSLTRMEPGTYAFIPRGTLMFGAFPEGGIVQVHGIGPFHIQWRDGVTTLEDSGSARIFSFRHGDAVTTPRGEGRILRGYASGKLIQYEVEVAGGRLFMVSEHQIRRR